MRFKYQIATIFSILCLALFGQEKVGEPHFIPNQGQWFGDFEYKLSLLQGSIFFQENGYTVQLYQSDDQHGEENQVHEHGGHLSVVAYRVKWVGSEAHNASSVREGRSKTEYYHNYFLGKDPGNWKSRVPVYRNLNYKNLYPGIDIRYGGLDGNLKYDIILRPGSSLRDLKMSFDGIETVKVVEGSLQITTKGGIIREWIPEAYQIIEGQKIRLNCNYIIKDGNVEFEVPGYKAGHTLVIDPVLDFSTFSGSAGANWGFTATYDNDGNFYGGGAAFNDQFPATTGAFQDTLGGQVDMAINKFSADGTALLYATYIGGTKREVPHSLVVNALGELYILGNTGSDDFPIQGSTFQTSFSVGQSFSLNHNGFVFPEGSNIVVARLSADGTSLENSTFFGGNISEGINYKVYKNYGDYARGEIITLANGNIAITSSSLSTNLPLTRVGMPPSDSSQNAIVVVFDPTLTNLVWGNYFGGTDHETGYSIKTDGTNVFLGGTSWSTDLPTGTSVPQDTNAGYYDGYIAKFNATSGQFINATYMGTFLGDQTFLIDVDKHGNVYGFGQSGGSMPITPGKYNNAGSEQFVQKYNNNLDNLLWSTQIGSGQGKSDLVPTAFMVDRCQNIYLSGWNGGSNLAAGSFSQSNTNNLPTTTDAFQTNTDGSDFYFMVLGRDADSLLFGSYFGGTSEEHVDGGTSRFSPEGIIYQAACAGCRTNAGFPTTPNSYSPTKPNNNCNFGAVKIDFQISVRSVPFIDFNTDVDTICDDLLVQLSNKSLNANQYFWDFGNGQTSNQPEPSVIYSDFGTYTITLIAIDTICDISDTNTTVVVHDQGVKPKAHFEATYVGCDQNYEVRIINNTDDADTYFWDFGDGGTSQNHHPVHNYQDSGTYTITLVAYDSKCNSFDTTSMQVTFVDTVVSPVIKADYTPCQNGEIDVTISGDRYWYLYHWTLNGVKSGEGAQPHIKVIKPGLQEIIVTIEDTLCNTDETQKIELYIEQLVRPTFIPNIFTPNNDGINEVFLVSGEDCDNEQYMRIFNRWGQMVFETYDPFNEFWDGTVNGEDVPAGVYSYILRNGDEYVKHHLTLIR